MPEAFDTFLSYHSGDAEWVVELKEALERKGVKVWLDLDQSRPGDRFVAVLEEALSSVRSVVLVVSRGFNRSSWVTDEYHRALTLANADPNRLRLIAVLIGDAEPPAFLANRHWVDFRDPDRFAASLDELVFGITGRRASATGRAASADMHRGGSFEHAAHASIDEVVCCARQIARTRVKERSLWRSRQLAPVAGLGLGIALVSLLRNVETSSMVAVIVSAPLVTGLVGWGVTATSLAACGKKLEQFEALHDGLEACRTRSSPGCTRVREEFWALLVRQIKGLEVSRT